MEIPDGRTGITAIGCDACDASTSLPPDQDLARPWRRFTCVGLVGDFHACSDEHEAHVRRRYERPEV